MHHKISGSLVRLAAVLGPLATGCMAVAPAEHYDRAAGRAGLLVENVPGNDFLHRVYRNPERTGEHLHVYLEGDGTPFVTPRQVARDPTPRRPLALRLMALDPNPAALVGRPCYHGLSDGCATMLWTSARYSEAVIASMTRVIERLMEDGGYRSVSLIGHSGGGAIAVLIAERLAGVDAVLTLAGNLDTEAWTAHHGYSPLTGSLNPADRIGSRPDLRHLHLTGGRDDNVPRGLQRTVRARLAPGALRTIDGFDHACCWESLWPAVLAELDP